MIIQYQSFSRRWIRSTFWIIMVLMKQYDQWDDKHHSKQQLLWRLRRKHMQVLSQTALICFHCFKHEKIKNGPCDNAHERTTNSHGFNQRPENLQAISIK